MILAEIALYISAFFYVVFLLAVGIGLRRLGKWKKVAPADEPVFLSVIIPARDEELTIAECIKSILSGTLDPSRFEIIVVSDHSTDNTVDVVSALARNHSNVRLIQLHNGSGKPAALNAGIKNSRGKAIATIDADCTASNDWLSSTLSTLSYKHPIVAGPVFYSTNDKYFSKIQALEFLGLVAVGAGCIGIGRPTICNSANLCYQRELYNQLAPHGFDDTPSSDEKMMQQVGSLRPAAPHFNMAPTSFVTAAPVKTVQEFFDQRRRWAASIGDFASISGVVISVIVFAFYLLLLILTPISIIGLFPATPVAIGWFAKVLPEVLVLGLAANHFGKMDLMWAFVPAQLVHGPYIIVATISGMISGHSWKGRKSK